VRAKKLPSQKSSTFSPAMAPEKELDAWLMTDATELMK
jgi:hypothetical protein